jgi:hypothetical protein
MNNEYILLPNGEFISDDELYHYGVRGMKWGVRRAMKELHESNSTGRKGGHNHAVAVLSEHRDKINKKISSLDKKSATLEAKRYKHATKNANKIADLERKAAKARLKAGKAFYTSTSDKKLHKAAKLDYKVSKLKKSAAKIQAKIEKNERLKEIYNKGLKDINHELITNGQDFLYMKSNGMPYTNADIE